MDDEYESEQIDQTLDQFETYEHYLDKQIQWWDIFYLEDRELARQLYEVGYHGRGEILSREDFYKKKQSIAEAIKSKHSQAPKALASADFQENISKSQFLQELARREERIKTGRLTSILFLRVKEKKKSKLKAKNEDEGKDPNDHTIEISGYIDLAHRLKTEDFKLYFSGGRKIKPKPTDLSFYNWESKSATVNESPNFRVDANSEAGLLFRNKRDRKVINVDPAFYDEKDKEIQTQRFEVNDPDYEQIVFFDHQTRRKH